MHRPCIDHASPTCGPRVPCTSRIPHGCPIRKNRTRKAHSARTISDKWKVLILRDLLDGTKRFSELRRSVGSVSQKVLTANLRQMERDGLVHREVFPEVPPRVEYSLTETGQTLQPVIEAMKNWGTQYKAAHAA